MSTIGKSFNDEMDRYLRCRIEPTKKGFFSFKQKSRKECVPDINDTSKIHIERRDEPFIKEFFKNLLKSKKTREIEAAIQKEKEEIAHTETLEEMKDEYEELDEIEKEIEEEKEMLLTKILRKLRLINNFDEEEKKDDELSPEEQFKLQLDLVLDDMKKLSKISHKWISRLSKLQLKKFKESDDFKEYKDILKRNKLIK